MRECVFIHTNDRQHVGALVSAYSFARNSAYADKFDVRLIEHKDFPCFARDFDGTTVWINMPRRHGGK